VSELVPLIRVAGAVQLGIAAVNFVLPSLLDYRGNLPRLSKIVRQIFIVHSFYIVGVLVIFGVLCLAYAPELAAPSGIGRFLCGALALFWLPRLPIQLFYYDRRTTWNYRWLNLTFIATLAYLGGVFLWASIGGGAR